LRDLVAEFELLRRANLSMFQHLPADAWTRRGVANGNNLSVRALAHMLLGHARHHLNILRKRLASGSEPEA
jgi:DinB superfamily